MVLSILYNQGGVYGKGVAPDGTIAVFASLTVVPEGL
jgi:hypothetical protein